MGDDVRVVPGGEHVVVGEDVLDRIERAGVPVDAARDAAGELALVVRLERDHVEAVAPHGDRAGILGADVEVPRHGAGGDVDDRDAVGGRERDVGLGVAREGDAGRLVEAGRESPGIDLLHRGDHLAIRVAAGVDVDDADGVRDVIREPHLLPVGPHRDAHRVDPRRNAGDDRPARRVDDVERVRRGVRHVDEGATDGEGPGVRAQEDGVADTVRGGLCVVLGGSGGSGGDAGKERERRARNPPAQVRRSVAWERVAESLHLRTPARVAPERWRSTSGNRRV